MNTDYILLLNKKLSNVELTVPILSIDWSLSSLKSNLMPKHQFGLSSTSAHTD